MRGPEASEKQARSYFGLDPDPSIHDIRAIAEHYPVFRVDYAPSKNRQAAGRGRSQ